MSYSPTVLEAGTSIIHSWQMKTEDQKIKVHHEHHMANKWQRQNSKPGLTDMKAFHLLLYPEPLLLSSVSSSQCWSQDWEQAQLHSQACVLNLDSFLKLSHFILGTAEKEIFHPCLQMLRQSQGNEVTCQNPVWACRSSVCVLQSNNLLSRLKRDSVDASWSQSECSSGHTLTTLLFL